MLSKMLAKRDGLDTMLGAGSGRRWPWITFYLIAAILFVLVEGHYAGYPEINHDAADGLMIAQSIGKDFCYCLETVPRAIFPPGESTNGIPQYVAGFFFATTRSPDIASMGTAVAGIILLMVALLFFEPWLVIVGAILILIWPQMFSGSIMFYGEVWAIAFSILGLVALRRNFVRTDVRSLLYSRGFLWAWVCFGFALEAKLITSLTLIPLIFAVSYQAIANQDTIKTPLVILAKAALITASSTVAGFLVLALSVSFSVAHSTRNFLDFGLMLTRVGQFVGTMVRFGNEQAAHGLIAWNQVSHFGSVPVLALLFLGVALLIYSNWTYLFAIVSTFALWLHFAAVERHVIIAIFLVIIFAAAETQQLVRRFSMARRYSLAKTYGLSACIALAFLIAFNHWTGSLFYGTALTRRAAAGFDRVNVVSTSVGPFDYSPELIAKIRAQKYVVVSGFWHFPEMSLRENLRMYDRLAFSNASLPKRQVALLLDRNNHYSPRTSVRDNCAKIIYVDGPLVLCRVRTDVPLSYQPPSPQAAGTSMVYPPGTVPFKSAATGLANGVFASPNLAHCCFLGEHANLQLEKPRGSRIVSLEFYIPGRSLYHSGDITLEVSVPGATKSERVKTGSMETIVLTFPPALARATIVPITIVPSKVFRPAGSAPDSDALSVILLRALYH